MKGVLATGDPVVNCELVLERPDHSRINVLANIAALRDSKGVITGAVSIFQDMTELKRAQQDREDLLHELERSNSELSQFSYNVSHDLQAPVRNVRALTQLLARREDNLQEDSSHVLTLIENAAAGMERLIQSLLRYAQAGQGHLNRQKLRVDQVIEAVQVTLTLLIAKSNARIVYQSLPLVDADPVLLEQVLQNLVANAIQYRRPEEAPVIEISCEPAGEGWQFAVKDNGQGIPRHHQDDIFEPLKRLHGSDFPGSGLGLALCRTIVTRHGGRIWVESEGPDQGAIFRFTLSAAHESPALLQSSSVA